MLEKILVKLLVALMLLSTLNACGKSAPECSSQDTVANVTKILRNELVKNGASAREIKETIIRLDTIRTTGINEKTGKQECACDVTVEGFDAYVIPIQYTSELTGEKGEFYTQVFGFDRRNSRKISTAKSDLYSLIVPNIKEMQGNISLIYYNKGILPSNIDGVTKGADTTHIVPSVSNGVLKMRIKVSGTDTKLGKYDGKELTLTPETNDNNQITKWKPSGSLTKDLGY